MKQRISLVLIGPQGSGKGTQAAILTDAEGFLVVEMGDLLRKQATVDSPLGRQLKDILMRGDLVPEEVTLQLVKEKLAHLPPDAKIVFDGFPRSIEQAKLLETVISITKAVHIDIPYEVSVKRISGRLMCPHGHYYNTFYLKPRAEGICNVDKLPLAKRPDDTEEAVKHRLELYNTVTSKVIAYYKAQGKLVEVDGDASIFAVSHEIKTKVLALL